MTETVWCWLCQTSLSGTCFSHIS